MSMSKMTPPPPTTPRVAPTIGDLPGQRAILPARPASWHRWNIRTAVPVLCGVAYVATTLFASTRFLLTSDAVLTNDFLWTAFNVTVGGVFVANALNGVLPTINGTMTAQLTDARFMYVDDVPVSARSIGFTLIYARMLQYDRLTSVEHGITGLRHTEPRFSAYIYAQYCWVDFDRRWSVAHTAERANRCQRSYADNGAVYLESLFRNVAWGGFMSSFSKELTTGVLNALYEYDDGPVFIESLKMNGSVALDEEAKYWRSKGMTHFQMQYDNAWQIGLDEKVDIVNAFGIRSAFTIKNSEFVNRWQSKTTDRMYWTFVNDMWAIVDNNTRISGMSLVRNSSNFYEKHGLTMEETMIEDGGIPFPFTVQDSLWRDAVGPFNSVDSTWRMFPPELAELFLDMKRIVLTVVMASDAARISYWDISAAVTIQLQPVKWLGDNWTYIGGSPFCSQQPGLRYVTQQFAFERSCAISFSEGWSVDRLGFVFIAIASTDVMDGLGAVCASTTANVAKCQHGLERARAFALNYLSAQDRLSLHTSFQRVRTILQPYNISIMQYATRTGANNITENRLLIEPIIPLNTTSAWNVFSWMYVYEWVTNAREVVTFEGDNGSLTLISGFSRPMTLAANTAELPTSVSPYLRFAVQYVTFMLSCVAVLVLFYAITSGFRIAGTNLLGFNRVSGIVWIGRPLLVLRGIVAIAILSTASPVLVQEDQFTRMSEEHQTVFTLVLAAGEATWLIIVAVDLMLVVTTGITHVYAPLVTNGVWATVVVMQLVSPMEHTVVIDPQCEFMALEKQITCSAGAIYVGNTNRMMTTLGILGGCLIGSYIIVRMCIRPRPGRNDSMLLPGIAREMFRQDIWVHQGNWFVDTASAAMAGLVTFCLFGPANVVDIKTWSRLHTQPPPPAAQEALPPLHCRRALRLRSLKLHLEAE